MLRSSTKFVARKDSDEVSADLKKIYTAAGEPEARIALAGFEVKWGRRYPGIAKAWEKEWTDLMVFMDFGECIRRMIYTTNPVEGLHRQIRKVTKTKGSWVNDKALSNKFISFWNMEEAGGKLKFQNGDWCPMNCVPVSNIGLPNMWKYSNLMSRKGRE